MSPGHHEPDRALRFPDTPKLELDQLIDQLVDRAQDVKRVQGRLRALLRATETIVADLSLDTVLRNIVEAGCELANARYGALGVIGPDGELEEFVHSGIDDATVAAIGHLPDGLGLLGALVDDPRPIRLREMSGDPRSVGFPPGHPPMTSFLGVPIPVGGSVFGNLYLSESRAGAFSDEDEELVVALALAAGAAISNARLYSESQLQQRWLSASVEIGARLLSDGVGEEPLHLIGEQALSIADADLVVVALTTADGAAFVVEEAVGVGADLVRGRRFPVAETMSGLAMARAEAVTMRSAADAGDRFGHLAQVMDAGPIMLLPLVAGEQIRGVLSVVRLRGRRGFSPGELAMASGFAGHASIALQLADSRQNEQKLVLLEDRDRIARDLHDHVIQELFAIGLGLESVAATPGLDADLGRRVAKRVEDIDATIRRIRTSIFQLRGALDPTVKDGLRSTVLDIAEDIAPALGFAPKVSFTGLVDVVIPADLAADVTAVVRESLTNVAKHARGSSVSVVIAVDADEVVVRVTDDGRGPGDTGRRSGIANLARRADRHAGTFTVGPGADGGTDVVWRAPIP